MSNIDIRTIWTNDITKTQTEEFRYVVNTVFGPFCTEEYFKLKYLENIYGQSVIIIAYHESQPVGTCSLWRNDLNGEEAYLAADACVLPVFQGKGIYSLMLKARSVAAKERGNALIYTFPNTNSYPRLLKKKWQVRLLRKVFCFPGLSSESIGTIDRQYALWWLKNSKDICHIKRLGQYFLVKQVRQKGMGRVLGRVDKATAIQFPHTKVLLWFLYCESEKVTFYNRKWSTTPVVYTNGDGSHIPFWKMDSL